MDSPEFHFAVDSNANHFGSRRQHSRNGMTLRAISKLAFAVSMAAGLVGGDATAQQAVPTPGSAKAIFGAVALPTQGPPQSIGFYAKGCLSGAVALPVTGPTWQAMRVSRNRRWGRPETIAFLERLSQDAAKFDGWPGILVGDISQPRGGPMFNGHASHQIGLDADVWLTPMPKRTLTPTERESLPFTTMLQKNAFLTIDPNVWTEARAKLLMRAGPATAATLASFGRNMVTIRISTSVFVALRVRSAVRRRRRWRPVTVATRRLPGGSRKSRGPSQCRSPAPSR
jgi:hypothetical protein